MAGLAGSEVSGFPQEELRIMIKSMDGVTPEVCLAPWADLAWDRQSRAFTQPNVFEARVEKLRGTHVPSSGEGFDVVKERVIASFAAQRRRYISRSSARRIRGKAAAEKAAVAATGGHTNGDIIETCTTGLIGPCAVTAAGKRAVDTDPPGAAPLKKTKVAPQKEQEQEQVGQRQARPCVPPGAVAGLPPAAADTFSFRLQTGAMSPRMGASPLVKVALPPQRQPLVTLRPFPSFGSLQHQQQGHQQQQQQLEQGPREELKQQLAPRSALSSLPPRAHAAARVSGLPCATTDVRSHYGYSSLRAGGPLQQVGTAPLLPPPRSNDPGQKEAAAQRVQQQYAEGVVREAHTGFQPLLLDNIIALGDRPRQQARAIAEERACASASASNIAQGYAEAAEAMAAYAASSSSGVGGGRGGGGAGSGPGGGGGSGGAGGAGAGRNDDDVARHELALYNASVVPDARAGASASEVLLRATLLRELGQAAGSAGANWAKQEALAVALEQTAELAAGSAAVLRILRRNMLARCPDVWEEALKEARDTGAAPRLFALR